MEELIKWINGKLEDEYELIERNKNHKSYGNKCLHQGIVSALEEVLQVIEDIEVE